MATGGLPQNAAVNITIDKDGLTAYICVTAPEIGGRDITAEVIRAELLKNGIRFGVDEQMIYDISDSRLYDSNFIIARGEPAVDGTDSNIEFLFDRGESKELKEDEFGNVDFRDLGFINNVRAGTVIANVTYETQGTDGISVKAAKIRSFPGKPVTYKPGSGTAFSPDKSQIVATVDGNLHWSKSSFVVDQTVVIGGDIDPSVGNIDFLGDVVIKGNVNEGFVVKSGKDVTVKGSVIGAEIYADGNITIAQGCVNSTVKGKDIKIGFCESSNIESSGALQSQSFVACNVHCEGEMSATGGKGVIVGGKYVCLHNIEANIIGSDTYTKTLLVLGNNAVLTEEKLAAEEKITELEKQIHQLEQAIEILKEQKQAAKTLPPEREEMLTASIRGRFVHLGAIKQLKTRITQIDAELAINQDLRVTAKRELFPGVSVRINNTKVMVENHNVRCVAKIGKSGEIEFTAL